MTANVLDVEPPTAGELALTAATAVAHAFLLALAIYVAAEQWGRFSVLWSRFERRLRERSYA